MQGTEWGDMGELAADAKGGKEGGGGGGRRTRFLNPLKTSALGEFSCLKIQLPSSERPGVSAAVGWEGLTFCLFLSGTMPT